MLGALLRIGLLKLCKQTMHDLSKPMESVQRKVKVRVPMRNKRQRDTRQATVFYRT